MPFERHPTGFNCAGSQFVILYPTGFESDADMMQRLCAQASSQLEAYFAPQNPAELMKPVSGVLRLLDGPAAGVTDNDSLADTQPRGRSLDVEVRHLTPSRNKTHGTWDVQHHLQMMVHELSIPFLGQITRRRWTGWQFLDEKVTPDWFRDGYEEYLAIALISATGMRSPQGVHAESRSDRHGLHSHSDLDRKRYVYGASIMARLHDLTDNRTVQSILSVQRTTFDEALEAQTGFTRDTLFRRWKDWLGTT